MYAARFFNLQATESRVFLKLLYLFGGNKLFFNFAQRVLLFSRKLNDELVMIERIAGGNRDLK